MIPTFERALLSRIACFTSFIISDLTNFTESVVAAPADRAANALVGVGGGAILVVGSVVVDGAFLLGLLWGSGSQYSVEKGSMPQVCSSPSEPPISSVLSEAVLNLLTMYEFHFVLVSDSR